MTRFLLTTRLVEHVCTIHEVPFATPRTLYQRMNKLREAGLIDRTRLLQTGEYCYHLTKLGAEFFAENDGLSRIPKKATTPPSISLQAHEFEVSSRAPTQGNSAILWLGCQKPLNVVV